MILMPVHYTIKNRLVEFKLSGAISVDTLQKACYRAILNPAFESPMRAIIDISTRRRVQLPLISKTRRPFCDRLKRTCTRNGRFWPGRDRSISVWRACLHPISVGTTSKPVSLPIDPRPIAGCSTPLQATKRQTVAHSRLFRSSGAGGPIPDPLRAPRTAKGASTKPTTAPTSKVLQRPGDRSPGRASARPALPGRMAGDQGVPVTGGGQLGHGGYGRLLAVPSLLQIQDAVVVLTGGAIIDSVQSFYGAPRRAGISDSPSSRGTTPCAISRCAPGWSAGSGRIWRGIYTFRSCSWSRLRWMPFACRLPSSPIGHRPTGAAGCSQRA